MRILMQAAERIGVPVGCKAYPQASDDRYGVERAVAVLRDALPRSVLLSRRPGLQQRSEDGRSVMVIAGMEAHVCVLQSALGFQRDGVQTVVVADAVSSRDPANREAALIRLRENGIEVATTEMVLFEWLGRAGTPRVQGVEQVDPMISNRPAARSTVTLLVFLRRDRWLVV